MISQKILVARIGKTVGLCGDLRLNLFSDFPEQFKKGATFISKRGYLTVSSYNANRGTIRFEGINDVENAKHLTNTYLYTTKEVSEEVCNLNEGEYFWYQIIGLEVDDVDGNDKTLLGEVEEIERLAGIDYLKVKTDSALVGNGFAKNFLIPYIERYVDRVDLKRGRVFTIGAKSILEAS